MCFLWEQTLFNRIGPFPERGAEKQTSNIKHIDEWFPWNPRIKTSRNYTYIILTPLKPIFYSKTWVYRSIYYLSDFCSKTRGGSNEYPQFMFWANKWKISEFLSENFQFLVVKLSIYLNRRVFLMKNSPLEAPREIEMRHKWGQHKRHIWNHWRTNN